MKHPIADTLSLLLLDPHGPKRRLICAHSARGGRGCCSLDGT